MKRNDWKMNLPLMLLVLSVALNVVLSEKLIALTQPVTSLQAGERVPALELKTLAGEPAMFAFPSQQPTLIYYFAPTCGWCEKNWANVKTVLEAANGHYRVIGLSPTAKDVDKVLSEHGVQMDVYTGVTPEISRAYHLNGTPQTVLVSPRGTVLAAWSGAYVKSQAQAVEAFFGLKLPGVASSSPATRP